MSQSLLQTALAKSQAAVTAIEAAIAGTPTPTPTPTPSPTPSPTPTPTPTPPTGSITVTGSSTPLFAGTYVNSGQQLNGYPYWECAGVGFIWNLGNSNWIVSAALGVQNENFVYHTGASTPPLTSGWNTSYGATGGITTS